MISVKRSVSNEWEYGIPSYGKVCSYLMGSDSVILGLGTFTNFLKVKLMNRKLRKSTKINSLPLRRM